MENVLERPVACDVVREEKGGSGMQQEKKSYVNTEGIRINIVTKKQCLYL